MRSLLLHRYPGGEMMKREERITKPRQYAEVYGKGKSYPSELIVLRTLPNNLDYSRYGISVSKKVGNAVTRNKLKRRLREINRIESILPGWDMVYIIRQPPGLRGSISMMVCIFREIQLRSPPGHGKRLPQLKQPEPLKQPKLRRGTCLSAGFKRVMLIP